mmetsp:Transcript_27493/g.110126  ORF Transcript_27493/g.110126 Transcript_27493/m.110126 type:complete len:320 (-) Transcript_27493:1250-2209(-)
MSTMSSSPTTTSWPSSPVWRSAFPGRRSSPADVTTDGVHSRPASRVLFLDIFAASLSLGDSDVDGSSGIVVVVVVIISTTVHLDSSGSCLSAADETTAASRGGAPDDESCDDPVEFCRPYLRMETGRPSAAAAPPDESGFPMEEEAPPPEPSPADSLGSSFMTDGSCSNSGCAATLSNNPPWWPWSWSNAVSRLSSTTRRRRGRLQTSEVISECASGTRIDRASSAYLSWSTATTASPPLRSSSLRRNALRSRNKPATTSCGGGSDASALRSSDSHGSSSSESSSSSMGRRRRRPGRLPLRRDCDARISLARSLTTSSR